MKKIQLLSVFVLLLFGFTSFGQNTYSGIITDAVTGDALIGVSIYIPATTQGTLSDIDGSFTLNANAGDVVEISYVGYKTQTITLTDETNLNVQLAVSSELLDEVVVVGYGTQKKSDLTGSIASIKAEDIKSVPTINAMQALQGKVSGLQILSTSGDPGAAPVVRLRGITTLNDNTPISMEVLKDASATAIYGSRGAAGVVIVTTKRGEAGENKVNISMEQGIESVANRIDVIDGREFSTYINGITPGTYNNLDALPNTDWQDLIFRDNARITNLNASVSGGTEGNTFYFGLGYFGQEGVLAKSGLERLTAKLNSEYKISNHLNVGLDLSASLSDKDNAPGVINTALRAWPIETPFLEDGVTYAEVNGGNALAAINFTNSNTDRLRGLGNFYARINFLDHFTFKSSIQFDVAESKTRSFSPEYFVGPLQQNEINDLTYGSNSNSTLIYENTLSYDNTFGVHGINVLAGYTTQDSKGENLTGFTEGLIREDPLFWYLNAGQNDLEQVSNGFEKNTLISYLGRVNYTYDSKYLLTASFRRDGSSRFGANNKYGNFYSAAVGWNISNEDFFPKDGAMNRLKFRASFGTIGNERIPGSAQYALVSTGSDAVFGPNEEINPGASFNGGGNPNLKWETTSQFNVGFDVGLMEDRLMAEIDYYQKNTSDILVPLEPIGYSGIGSFRSIFFNAADVKNQGIEWNVSYRNNVNDWSYEIGILGSTLSNEVTNIGQGFGADSLLVGGDLGNGQQVARSAVGFPIGYFYGYEVEGIFQTDEEVASSAVLFGQGPGDLKYRDLNGDGRISGDDRTQIGSSIPSLIYGLSANVGYKNFSLAADFQGQSGNDIYNGKQAIRFTTLNYEDKYNTFWTGPGSTNEDPRPSQGGNNFLPSSYYIEDGSFLRLRTITFSYDFSESFLNKLHLQNASVYVRGTNVFTATAFTGYSPEIGASSAIDGVIDRGVYPVTRVITLGLNANF